MDTRVEAKHNYCQNGRQAYCQSGRQGVDVSSPFPRAGITAAISGSRPYALHAAGFYRESAALLGSHLPGVVISIVMQ
jgi:hypothetical protein